MQTANSIAVMREVLAQAEAALSQSQKETAEARARAEKAEVALETARASQDELGRVKKQLETAVSNVFARDVRLDSLGIELKAAEERASSAEEIARRSDARVRELEEAIRGEKGKTLAAEERASSAEGRAAAAEERVSAAEERTTAAEEKASAAEERAVAAVEVFRKSAAFAEELAEASAGVYLFGFRDAKEKVGRIYGLSGLDDIEPDEVSEGSAASPGPTGDEAGPGED